jgi:hypothetical protein
LFPRALISGPDIKALEHLEHIRYPDRNHTFVR